MLVFIMAVLRASTTILKVISIVHTKESSSRFSFESASVIHLITLIYAFTIKPASAAALKVISTKRVIKLLIGVKVSEMPITIAD
jgi:hypothetical protein